MDLAGLRKQHSSTALEEPSEAPEVLPPSVETVGGSSSAERDPWGVSQVVTPNGIEVYYQAGPKRLYRLREWRKPKHAGDTGYVTDWVDAPSVSEVLNILDKPGLPWWGMKVGVEGLLALLGEDDPEIAVYQMLSLGTDGVVDLLTKNKLTVNHVRDKAGDRGTAVHDALEVWANSGKLAPPNVFEEEERGYVQALNDFLTDFGGEAYASEVMVGSLEWQFAGRFDLAANVPDGARVVTKSYPKRASKVEAIPGGRWLLDLKTSKGVYETHHLQLAAYRQAYAESYGEQFDHTGVIHVFPDGRYELVAGKATDDDFQNVLVAYRSLQRLK